MVFDFCPSSNSGKLAEQHVGDDEAEQRVAEKLHRLVVGDAAADVLVGARRVGHRVLEQAAIAEAIADRLLQRLELVAQPHDLAVLELGAVALDDALRLVGLAGVDRDAHLGEAVDRHRKDRVRHVGRDHRHDAVGLEQAADDLRFDVGVVRKMTTRSVTVARRIGDAPSPASRRRSIAVARAVVDLQQDHRHVVVLRRIADEGRDLAQHALAQLLRRQVRVGLDQLRPAASRRTVVARVHRLADAVGEQQVEIAGLQRDRLLDQVALEHLAVVELQADDHAVRREDLHLPRRAVGARRPGT